MAVGLFRTGQLDGDGFGRHGDGFGRVSNGEFQFADLPRFIGYQHDAVLGESLEAGGVDRNGIGARSEVQKSEYSRCVSRYRAGGARIGGRCRHLRAGNYCVGGIHNGPLQLAGHRLPKQAGTE